MDISIDTIISIITLLIGGGSGAFFTWKWQKKKAKAEAEAAEAQAETESVRAVKELQSVYQTMIDDIKEDRNEKNLYIQELKEDRQHLRADRDELRDRQDKLEETVRDLQRQVARAGRMIESVRPYLCGRTACPDRILVNISSDGTITPKSSKKAKTPKQEKS